MPGGPVKDGSYLTIKLNIFGISQYSYIKFSTRWNCLMHATLWCTYQLCNNENNEFYNSIRHPWLGKINTAGLNELITTHLGHYPGMVLIIVGGFSSLLNYIVDRRAMHPGVVWREIRPEILVELGIDIYACQIQFVGVLVIRTCIVHRDLVCVCGGRR